ncbi:MAG: ComEA family DNA-binding protein [Pseudomonadales bacterium]
MKMIKSLFASVLMASALTAGAVHAEPAKNTNPSNVAAAPQPAVAATVNINTADAVTLADRLNGIGMKKAQAIISFREQNGAFKSVDDLVNVPGIGQATLEKNRSLIDIK